jgi:hypothetical protein
MTAPPNAMGKPNKYKNAVKLISSSVSYFLLCHTFFLYNMPLWQIIAHGRIVEHSTPKKKKIKKIITISFFPVGNERGKNLKLWEKLLE